MSLTRNIAHNTFYQIVSKVIGTGIGIVVVMLLTDYFVSPQGYGQYTTVIAFLQFFAIIADMGLYIVLTTKISQPGVNADQLVSNIFTLRLISAIVLLGAAPIVALFVPTFTPLVKTGIALTSFSFLAITLNQVLWGVFQKHLQVAKVSISEIIGRIVLLVGTLLAIWAEKNLLWILGAIVAGSVVNFFVTLFYVQKYVRLRLAWDMPVWKDTLRVAWPIAISVFFNLIYFKADTLILQYYHGDTLTGLYGAPYKILEVLISLPAMFAGLVLPILSESFIRQDMERFRRVLQKALDFLAMMAIPLVVGTILTANQLVLLLFDEKYQASGSILQVLIIATGVIFFGNLFGNTIVAIGRQRTMIFFYCAVAVIAVTGYFYFIPRYATSGAAWMTVVSESLITLASTFMVYRATKTRPKFGVLFKILFASIIMGAAIVLLSDLPILLVILLAASVYIGALLLLRAVTVETLKEILSLKSST